jgi:hypothetical protein
MCFAKKYLLNAENNNSKMLFPSEKVTTGVSIGNGVA